MQYNIHSKNIKVTNDIQNFINTQLNNILINEDNGDFVIDNLKISISQIKNKFKCEISTSYKNNYIKISKENKDIFYCISLCINTFENQLNKIKIKNDKINNKTLNKLEFQYTKDSVDLLPNKSISNSQDFNIKNDKIHKPLISLDNETQELNIKREKLLSMKPITPEEACIQLELLGHDFYMFLNKENNNYGVIYKRKDDDGYGLISPNI